MLEFGVLYIAFGWWHVVEASRSVEILKERSPDTPCAIIVDRELFGSALDKFDYIIGVKRQEGHHEYTEKVRCMMMTPFENTVFVDADTYALKDLQHLKGMLATADLACCRTKDGGEWATGVVMYNRTKAAGFFSDWLADMTSIDQSKLGYFHDIGFSNGDQNAFNRVLPKHLEEGALRFRELPFYQYNAKDELIDQAVEKGISDRIVIAHSHDWRKYGPVLGFSTGLMETMGRKEADLSGHIEEFKALLSEGRTAAAYARAGLAMRHMPYVHLLLSAGYEIWSASADDARRFFEAAVAADPRSPQAHAALGYWRYGAGDHQGAFAALQRAQQLGDTTAHTRETASRAYKALSAASVA